MNGREARNSEDATRISRCAWRILYTGRLRAFNAFDGALNILCGCKVLRPCLVRRMLYLPCMRSLDEGTRKL